MNTKGTILIVEDTPADLELLVDTLTAEGYQALPAESGEIALASVAARPPELILLDIQLPGLDGFEVCRRLKAQTESRDIPIMFLSASGESAERVTGLKLGAVDYISKPFQREELLARVQIQVELGRLRVRLAQQAGDLRQANEQLQSELAERKRAESEIQRQAAFARFNPNPVLELSAVGEINYFNDAAGEMARALGLEDPAQMLPPNLAAIVRQCLATGKPQLRVETQFGPHPGCTSGVRPSSGAATPARRGVLEISSVVSETEPAAPENGRAPDRSPSLAPASCAPPTGPRVISWSFFPVQYNNTVHCYAGDITERKREEEALRASQQIIEGILNAIPVRVFWKDQNLVYLGCNAVFARDAGFADPKEVIGKDDYQMGWREQAESYRNDDRQVIESGRSKLLIEEAQTTPAGIVITLLTSKLPLLGSKGEVSGVIGMYMDITERKQAEEVLQQRLKLQDQLVHTAASVPGMIYSLLMRPDGSTRMPYASGALSEIFDLQPKDVIEDAARVFSMIHPGDIGHVMATIAESARTLNPWRDDFRVCHTRLGQVWVEGHSVPQREPDGSVLWHGFVQDITKRKEMEIAMTRLGAIVESSDDAIIGTDLHSLVTTWNKGAEKLFGYTASEMAGTSVTRLVPADRQEEENEILGKITRGESVGHFETQRQNKDERLFEVSITASPIKDATGKVIGVSKAVRDITERKRAETQLKLFRALVDQSKDFFLVLDPETGRLLDVNEQGCLSHGYSREEFLALRVFDIDPTVGPAEFTKLGEILREKGVLTWQGQHRRKDGSTFPVEVNLTYVRLDRGYNVAAVRDITERKRAEERLQQSEERLRIITDSAQDAILMMDPKGKVAYWNPAAERILGYTRAEAIGQSLHDLIAPGRFHPAHHAAFPAFLRTGQGAAVGKTLDLEARRKDGQEIAVQLSLSAVQMSDGWHAVGLMRDITERRRTESALAERARLSVLAAEVGAALTNNPSLHDSLQGCAAALVKHLDAAFARVWTLNAQTNVLELRASAGMYTHLDGAHGRVPVGQSKIGLIAQERKPQLTNQVLGDPLVEDQEWAKREGMVSFAGYPLVVDNRLLGVMALFARHPLTDPTLRTMAGIADNIALGIERMHSDMALRQSEARMRLQTAALESAANGVVITDLKGTIQWVNPAFTELTGYSAKEAIGQNPRVLKSGQHPDSFYQDLWRTISSGDVWAGELINRRKDGQSYYESMTITPVRDACGAVTHFIAIKQNISERKRAEIELVEKERLLSEAQRLGHIGSWLFETTGAMRWTEELYRIYGVSPDTFTPTEESLVGLMHPEDRPAMQAWMAACAGGEKPGESEFRINLPDGTIRWIRGHGDAVYDAGNRLTHIAGTAKDITERKAAEARLEGLQKQLVEASRRSGMAEIATNVLHNVGNVLNSVNISTTLIVQSVKQSRASSLARVVVLLQEHAHDLGEFITHDSRGKHLPAHLAQLSEHLLAEQETNLRELSSLRQNVEHIKEIVAMQQNYATFGGMKEMVQVADLVEDSLRLNEGALSRHEVEVIREFEAVPPLNLEKHKFLQIMVNLLRNAKHACQDSERADKQITVRVANGEGRIKISVIDNGVGIPPENLTRIFNHGFTTRKGGHGFGLHSGALAAKEMGGSLTAHSDGPGQGAVFTLELPGPAQESLA